MTVFISAKQIKKRGDQVAAVPYILREAPATLRQLIAMLVTDSVERYNRRIQGNQEPTVVTGEQLADMSRVGKIAFGIPFGGKAAELEPALETAFQGFEDGLYRVFLGEAEMESLDAPLELHEGDTITIIRLVMLTGGWL